jgi:hypothetical protein
MDEHGEHKGLHGLSCQSVIPYIHGSDECCIARFGVVSSELVYHRACLNSLPTLAFYSSRPGSYIETMGPTGGPEVVETLYNIQGPIG